MNFRDIQRDLAALLPGTHESTAESTLELQGGASEAPRLVSAEILEDAEMKAHDVHRASSTVFRAFLDGTQKSRVARYVGTVPIIVGSVSAVVRERVERRMRTWKSALAEDRIYAPRALLPAVTWSTLEAKFGASLADTRDDGENHAHPFAIREAAVHQVQTHREQIEYRLAGEWCESETEPLYVDGSISGSDKAAAACNAIGVVKSHRTLYANGPALNVVLAMAQNQRSSVFRIAPRKRAAVASWYLRLRDTADHNPLFGLVRVETALATGSLTDRADEISSWVLAETSPLALPDSRWDTMAYGIRDCEEYLRSIQFQP